MMATKIIKPSKYHRMVNGTELVKAREGLSITQAVFAELCGWTQPHQSELEVPGDREIPTETAEKIMEVIQTAQTP